MTTRFVSIIAVLLLVFSTTFGGQIVGGTFAGRVEGSRVYISWQSDDESGVVRFELERKAGANGVFMVLASLNPTGNGSMYQYIDESAFRIVESIYQYRVKVVLANSDAVYYGPITVRLNISNVQRTWGSIKAMFR